MSKLSWMNHLSGPALGRMMLAVALTLCAAGASAQRLTLDFNPGWKFIKADPTGAQATDFTDADWETVSAPHTYNDVDTFDDWSLEGHRGEQNQWSGRTWYRKSFQPPVQWRGRRVFIEFEGVRQIAEVYLNGELLGVSKTGFTPFGFDLTPHLRWDTPNVLAVMCDNRFQRDPLVGERVGDMEIGARPSLSMISNYLMSLIPEDVADLRADQIPWNNPHWHPAHGGIYRNVKLIVTDPLHVTLPLYSYLQTAGPYVFTRSLTPESASIGVEIPVVNGRNAAAQTTVRIDLLDHTGRTLARTEHSAGIPAGGSRSFNQTLDLVAPRLWQPVDPYLYTVAIELAAGGEAIDRVEVPFGIREARWDVATGLHLNGAQLKLRGWGQKATNEWPGIGAAQPDWLQYFTMALMREAGANFVRWGHVTGGPAQITAGDRLGIIAIQPGVDGEHDTVGAAWAVRAQTFRDMIIYFRNNPSILIWEGGNQKISREHAAELRGYMDTFDPHGGRVYTHRRADRVVGEFMEIGVGTEGGRELKDKPVVEGEYNREESPRRVWDHQSPPNFGYPEAEGMTYQLTSEEFAVNQVTHFVGKLGAPDHAGGANWIFSDSTSGGRVPAEVARASGEVDGMRLPKEAFYVCQAMWSDQPSVHIVGHWTYPADTVKNVFVVSNQPTVELRVNGRSLGAGERSQMFLFTFKDVAWEAGEIVAIASDGGRETARQAKRTAGNPVALRMTPITGPGGLRADGSDYVLIDVEAVDATGERHPTFERRVDFITSGPGVWRGGYNSGRINSTNVSHLNLECGINRVAVRSLRQPGRIIVRAESPGLEPAELSIESQPVQIEHGFIGSLPVMPAPELPAVAPETHDQLGPRLAEVTAPAAGEAYLGSRVTGFSYSGPSAGARIAAGAADGRQAYGESLATFGNLPAYLRGADFVLAPAADALYNAVDLMEIGVRAGTRVTVAHDDRLPRPAWLGAYRSTGQSIMVGNQPMSLFERIVESDTGLTFGANAEGINLPAANMYVIFFTAR